MFDYFQQIYNQLLGYFPAFLHPVISVVLAVLLIYSIFQVIKRNFIFLIVLVVLLPASVPILKNIVDSLVKIVKYLLGMS